MMESTLISMSAMEPDFTLAGRLDGDIRQRAALVACLVSLNVGEQGITN